MAEGLGSSSLTSVSSLLKQVQVEARRSFIRNSFENDVVFRFRNGIIPRKLGLNAAIESFPCLRL